MPFLVTALDLELNETPILEDRRGKTCPSILPRKSVMLEAEKARGEGGGRGGREREEN